MKRAASSPIQRAASALDTAINGAKRVKLSTDTSSSSSGGTTKFKFISWNVNGLKALQGKETLKTLLDTEKPHVVCLQETKLQPSLEKKYENIHKDYIIVFNSSEEKKGHSGTAMMLRKDFHDEFKPKITTQSNPIDKDGRTMTIDLPQFFLVNTYVLNSGDKLQNLQQRIKKFDPQMLEYLKKLRETKPVIWCGDLNCARTEIDLARPKTNKKTAGFTPQEREQFENVFAAGFVDTWRVRNPETTGAYTYWSYRHQCKAKNLGWRLDYFLVTPELNDKVTDSSILDTVTGSDHCPIRLELDMSKGESV